MSPFPATQGPPEIVLLVHPDPDALQSFAAMLESGGIWVATATAPVDAAAAIDELKPDAVVVDADGWPRGETEDLVRALKSRAPRGDTPVLVLTADIANDVAASARRISDLVLTKPVAPDALIGRIRECVDMQRHARQPEPARSLPVPPSAVVPEEEPAARPVRLCPQCGGRLEWLERGTIDGTEYDYYRWCLNDSSLYCYDIRAARWLKLA